MQTGENIITNNKHQPPDNSSTFTTNLISMSDMPSTGDSVVVLYPPSPLDGSYSPMYSSYYPTPSSSSVKQQTPVVQSSSSLISQQKLVPHSPPSSQQPQPQQLPMGGITKKKRKVKKNKIIIPTRDMIKYFAMPQQVAAQKLNVSISTLKRRFYELQMIKWPANHTLDEFNFCERNAATLSTNGICGYTDHLMRKSAGYYSLYREPTTQEKTLLSTLINCYNTADEKFLDPMTMAILNEAFKAHLEG